MKRIIPLIFLAVAAVFLLTGCDAMLKAIYPNQVGGDNTVSVTVYAPYYYYQPIVVALYDSSGTYVGSAQTYASSYYDGYYYSGSVSFSSLKDDTYTAEAWLETVAVNNIPDSGEPYNYTSSYFLSGGSSDSLTMTLY